MLKRWTGCPGIGLLVLTCGALAQISPLPAGAGEVTRMVVPTSRLSGLNLE